MRVNSFFESQYLIPGNTYDNFIFESCPDEFLSFAKKKLTKGGTEVKPCVVCLDKEQEALIETTLGNFSEDFQKQVLARDFITSAVVRELLQYTEKEPELRGFVNTQLTAFLQNDADTVRQMHGESLIPYDVSRLARKVGKIELDFILDGTQNKFLQQAINIFISSREPYSVKVFTNNDRLPTYYDTSGNLIECPHDYLRRNVNEFIYDVSAENEK